MLVAALRVVALLSGLTVALVLLNLRRYAILFFLTNSGLAVAAALLRLVRMYIHLRDAAPMAAPRTRHRELSSAPPAAAPRPSRAHS